MAENVARTTAQHPHPARRPGPRPARSGPATSTRRSSCFAADSDVMFACHHWPRWGGERIVDLPREAARPLRLPARPDPAAAEPGAAPGRRSPSRSSCRPSLAAEWHCRELLRLGQPQREGDLPALHGLVRRQPGAPLAAPAGRGRAPLRRVHGRRRGGAGEGAPSPSRRATTAGSPRSLNHVVFADPEQRGGARLQADALEQLGYGAENATWRNFFLTGAKELREGVSGTPTSTAPRDIVARLSVEQLLDAMAIRLDGPRAAEHRAADRLGRHRPRRGSTRSPSATASSATAPAATSRPPTRPSSSTARRSTSCC